MCFLFCGILPGLFYSLLFTYQNSVTEMSQPLSPQYRSMYNAIVSCLTFDAEIRLMHNDVPFVVSITGAMVYNNQLCDYNLSTVIPLESIAKLECTKTGPREMPAITVWLKQESQSHEFKKEINVHSRPRHLG